MSAPPPTAESASHPPGRAGRRAAEAALAARRSEPLRPADTPLVWIAAAVFVGFLLSVPLGGALGPLTVLVSAGAALLAWATAWRWRRDRMATVALLASVALLAVAWASTAWRWFPADDLGRFARRDAAPVCFDAVVASAPTVYPAGDPSPFRAIPTGDRTVIEVRATAIRDGATWRSSAGRCEVTVAGRMPGLTPGDTVRVFGQLRSPSPAMNPGQRDAAARERRAGRLANVWTASPECVSLTGDAVEGWFGRAASRARRWSIERIERVTPASSHGLVRAMVLGDASTLPTEVVDAFRETGTLHVLVVSGLHVGLAAALLPGLAGLGVVPRRAAWAGSLLLVIAYVLIAGGRPPAVRAGVVAAAACIAALSGRQPLSLNSLAGAAVAVFAISPGAWATVGTRLSFTAAATLLAVAGVAARRRATPTPPLERLIQSVRSPGERVARRFSAWTGWAIAATLAVQVVVGPLVAAEFHLVSPAATPLALVISPLIALTVGAGLGALGLGLIGVTPLATCAGSIAGGAGELLGDAVEWTATWPAASFWVAGPTPWWSLAWIAVAMLAAIGAAYGLRTLGASLRIGLALVAVAFAPTLWRAAAPAEELRCSFISVGHGCATLIETPDGGAILVDAGALGSPERVTDTVSRFLWSRGVTRLDAVVLTHPDVDHYNAVPGLLDRFEIDLVWSTTLMFPRADDAADRSGPAELKRLLTNAGVALGELRMGARLPIGATLIEVLHPDDIGVVGSDNANSLVLGVEYAGRRVLLPGDLESPGLERVLAQEPYDCDVLLAPHHGSRRSNPPGFAAWCRPEAVIISSGEDRSEAVAAYRDAGADVLATHDAGCLTARLSSGGVLLETFR